MQHCDGNYQKLFCKILGVKTLKHARPRQIISVATVKESHPPKQPKRRTKHAKHAHGKPKSEPSLLNLVQDQSWLMAQFTEFEMAKQRRENELRNSNSLSENSLDKSDSLDDDPLSPILIPEKWRGEQSPLSNTTHSHVQVFPLQEPNTSQKEPSEEEEDDQADLDEDHLLRKFISMFVTRKVFDETKRQRSAIKLVFPPDKERPWDYNNESGDLIIDSVSEIMATADLTNVEYKEFLEYLAQQLKQRPMSGDALLDKLATQFHAEFSKQELEIINVIADQLLHAELNHTLNCFDLA